MRKLVLVVFVLFLVSNVVLAQTNHRPVTDFTSAQMETTGWATATSQFVGVIDIGGAINRWLANNGCGTPDFGTTFNGDITEKALEDGRTQVHVVLQGKNAFMRAMLLEDGTPVMGYTKKQICYEGGTAVLGEFTVTIDFINNEGLGGPMPDLWTMMAGQLPGAELQSFLLNAKAKAPLRFYFELPEGTPGFMRIVQRSPYQVDKGASGVPGKDYWPSEIVEVKPLGN